MTRFAIQPQQQHQTSYKIRRADKYLVSGWQIPRNPHHRPTAGISELEMTYKQVMMSQKLKKIQVANVMLSEKPEIRTRQCVENNFQSEENYPQELAFVWKPVYSQRPQWDTFPEIAVFHAVQLCQANTYRERKQQCIIFSLSSLLPHPTYRKPSIRTSLKKI